MTHKLNLFQGYFRYFKVYYYYIGSSIYLLFLLTFFSVVTDGIGIMMLLPLLKVTFVADGDLGAIAEYTLQILNFMGIPVLQHVLLMFIGFIFLIKGAIKFAEGILRSHMVTGLERKLRNRLFARYLNVEYKYYTSKNSGHFINVLISQIQLYCASFNAFTAFTTQIVTVLGYFIFAMFLSWQFTLLSALGSMSILLLFKKLSNYSRRLSLKVGVENSTLQRLIVQTLHGLKYLSATASTLSMETKSKMSIDTLCKDRFRLEVAGALTAALREPVTIFFLIVIMLVQIFIFKQPIAPIMIAIIIFNRALKSIMSIQASWQKVMKTISGLEMTEREIEQAGVNAEIQGEGKIERFTQGIELKNVTFSFTEKNILNNISLKIPAKSSIAIVGESGSGKSTLVDLITLLLKPNEGNIIIDGIDYKELNYRSWRTNIGFVTQETVIFDDTIANNISLWNCEIEKNKECSQEIEKAAEQAFCHPFISDLPEGYQTIVGERGVKLSGGQRQRLFVARELFKKPSLLILDEATSSLDTESERYMQKSIDQLKGIMTVIIIAHRLSTIKNVDHIYVLDNGKIIENGSYDQLMENKNSRFGKMIEMQAV
ncbi:MAG: ABC transporter ATP-binding protein [Bacteroidetes bacterium]|nr:ABC transporter ATP-binding protein [Bacteroidota bacterium]